MNPSFEAFVDPPDGFHDKPGTPSKSEEQFSPPEARMAGEPRMQLFAPSAPAEKDDFWFWAPKNGGFSERLENKKSRRKIFWGGRKSYLAAEHHNEAAPKKKKKVEVFQLGRRKILLPRRPPKKPIFGFGRRKNKKGAGKQKLGAEKKLGGEFFSGGVEKVIWPPNTITRRCRGKKKKTFSFRLGAEKYHLRPPKEQRPSNFLSRPS